MKAKGKKKSVTGWEQKVHLMIQKYVEREIKGIMVAAILCHERECIPVGEFTTVMINLCYLLGAVIKQSFSSNLESLPGIVCFKNVSSTRLFT